MSYAINEIEYDENSAINQKIKEKFVESHVMCCMTAEVEFMLDATIAGFRNESNVFTADDWETAHQYDGEDENGNEVLEWWAVDEWMGRMLSKHGEIVLGSCGKDYWGRCCS